MNSKESMGTPANGKGKGAKRKIGLKQNIGEAVSPSGIGDDAPQTHQNAADDAQATGRCGTPAGKFAWTPEWKKTSDRICNPDDDDLEAKIFEMRSLVKELMEATRTEPFAWSQIYKQLDPAFGEDTKDENQTRADVHLVIRVIMYTETAKDMEHKDWLTTMAAAKDSRFDPESLRPWSELNARKPDQFDITWNSDLSAPMTAIFKLGEQFGIINPSTARAAIRKPVSTERPKTRLDEASRKRFTFSLVDPAELREVIERSGDTDGAKLRKHWYYAEEEAIKDYHSGFVGDGGEVDWDRLTYSVAKPMPEDSWQL